MQDTDGECTMLTDSVIESILRELPTKTIGVFGDLFLDRYLDIDADLTEPSLETGLDALQVVRVRSYPGALGTVINNLAALGAGKIRPVSVIGDDGEGYELRQALQALRVVDLAGVLISQERRTPTYIKPMIRERGQAPRELNRLDVKNRSPTPRDIERRVSSFFVDAWTQCSAWIVLDQVSGENCGVVTQQVRTRLAGLVRDDPSKFVLADSRERIGDFRGVSVKPNSIELVRALGRGKDFPTEEPALLRLAEELSRRVGGTVFCTRGENATLVVTHGIGEVAPTSQAVPAYPWKGPIDTAGAGDSVSAAIASAMACGVAVSQAAAFGNLVASITIQQIGTTGTATPEAIRRRWNEVKSSHSSTGSPST
jgi:bifunctional ADP-heptose synthase (sugar kinase/adenylyltransferase)